jgi:CRISPR-associated endonuclease Csn1
LFENENYKESEFDKIDFTKDSYEENKDGIEEILEADEFSLLEAFEGIYNWALLSDILQEHEFISDAKIASYESHKKDILQLKALVKKYKKESYYKAFKDPTIEHNYAHYIGTGSRAGKKTQIKHKSKCAQAEVNKFFEKLLSDIEEPSDKILTHMREKLTFHVALPKQRIRDNRVIPQQLHKKELTIILKNASIYHPFLSIPDEDGYTPVEKILSMFSFRIPYYVGPLNTFHMKESGKEGFAWMVRQKGKEKTQILPWNWEQVVDKHASATKFITRMTNVCTYLDNESVLPKHSLLYTKYMVLNELNNLKINQEPISVELKQQLYKELFLESGERNISLKKLKSYLITNNIIDRKDENSSIEGIDTNFTSSLRSHIDFYKPFLKTGILLEEDVENIILWKTFYVDDAVILKEKIGKSLGTKLTENQINQIIKIVSSYKGWGRLSKVFLEEVYAEDSVTGETRSIIQAMWDTNYNLMELLSNRFTYLSRIQEMNQEHLSKEHLTYDSLVKPLAVSPSVKRQIWQTLLIVRELKKVMNKEPKRIFLEMAREKGEKKRIPSRKENLIKLYDQCKNDIQFNVALYQSLEGKTDSDLRNDKLYFYYTQLGKCLYCGEDINIHRMVEDYDIDHIYPQSLIKDDSLHNRVLVHKKCNGEKKDDYPLRSEWQANRRIFWNFLLEKQLISKEKHYRLTRNTELGVDDINTFINRQLVETRQSTKYSAQILKKIYGDNSTIVFVKAKNITEFRAEYEIKKSRLVNDFHHAHDAYLNIVVGNTYHTKFTDNPRNFALEWKKGLVKYHASNLFAKDVERGGVIAWV